MALEAAIKSLGRPGDEASRLQLIDSARSELV